MRSRPPQWGPLKENDRAQQIQVVQQFVAQDVDGIVLAPLDFKALVRPVGSATAWWESHSFSMRHYDFASK